MYRPHLISVLMSFFRFCRLEKIDTMPFSFEGLGSVSINIKVTRHQGFSYGIGGHGINTIHNI